MKTRCKFTCVEASPKESQGPHSARLVAVVDGSDENKQFFAATPFGDLRLSVVREQHFSAGQSYYVDISEAAGPAAGGGDKATATGFRWLARQSSSGDLFVLRTGEGSEDEAYRLFAREVLGLDTSGDFDVGNVDVDLWPLGGDLKAGAVRRLEEELA